MDEYVPAVVATEPTKFKDEKQQIVEDVTQRRLQKNGSETI